MPYLIDGYNLFFVANRGKKIGGEALEAAREAFLQKLAQFNARKGAALTVVFDSGAKAFTYGLEKTDVKSGVKVVFTPEKQSADDWIIESVKQSRDPAAMRVVSSDNAVIKGVEKAGAMSFLASEFWEEVEHTLTADMEEVEYEAKEKGISESEAKRWLKEFGLEE